MILSPTHGYSGLTCILDRPSRFDMGGLLMGKSGGWFDDCLLADAKHGIHRGNVEIRTLDESGSPFREGTKTLLLLGEDTLKHYNQTGVTIGEQRGSPFYYEDKICIATYSPQDAHDRKEFFAEEDSEGDSETGEDDSEGKSTHGKTRRKNFKFWARQDIRKAVRLCKTGITTSEPKYILYPSVEDVIRVLSGTVGGILYFDIETDSCLQLTCFGFSVEGQDEVYVVPGVQTHLTPRKYFYEETDWCRILRALSLALCRNIVVIHNSMFDLFVLVWRYGLPIGNRVFDTMLSHNRCYIEVEKSLGHVISLYTDLPYHKNEGVFEPRNHAEAESLYRYNGKDVYAMKQLKPAIEARAKALGATESVEQVNRAITPYLTAMIQGLNVNWEKIKDITARNDRHSMQIVRILDMLTGKKQFNPNSWKQVSAYLYDELGIDKPKKDPTNEKTLLQLLLKVNVPAIHGILEYRKVEKQSSKLGFYPWRTCDGYTPEGLLKADYTGSNRFTCAYNLAGTTSMRLSSRKLLGRKNKKAGTYLGGWGDNSQNFEKYLRKCIVPDMGKVLGQNDQSGAEALIVAYLCRPGKFRDLFIHGIKPHVFVALHVFAEQWARMTDKVDNKTLIQALVAEPKDLKNVPGWAELEALIASSDDWDSSRRYYFIGKMICHASNYGMKARTFRINVLQKSDGAIALTVQQCEQMLEMYHRLFPEIREWHMDIIAEVKRYSLLRNLFGHPRVITGHHDESAYKEWFAQKPQSTVGQITNYAFTELQEENELGMHPPDFDVLQNNHDSILWQSLPENRDYCSRLVSSKLNRRLVSPRGDVFFMKSDAQWSDVSWGDMVKLKLN